MPLLQSMRGTVVRGEGQRERGAVCQHLESRVLLANTPFPDIGDLLSPNNTVVRIETAFGDIDIELYDQAGPSGSAAPITTANFLNYVNSGRYDLSFFHRMPSPGDFVLQGGGFKFDDTLGLSDITEDDPIVNEFSSSRSNIERTVAMAKLGTGPDTATSQWFFNLGDNSANLDTQNGGFTVFGVVVQGWEVVEEISGFTVRNLRNNAEFDGEFRDNFREVPVTRDFSATDVTELGLVMVLDAEVIKPANFGAFFEERVYMPEGFRGSNITETLDLFNPNDVTAAYQVLFRYETGLDRDVVVASGTLEAGQSLRIPVSALDSTDIPLLRSGAPFAYEVQTAADTVTAIEPVAAALTRSDFGNSTYEAFFDVNDLSSDALRRWEFGRAANASQARAFLVWQNLSHEDGSVTVQLIFDSGATFSTVRTLEGHRRGGLNLREMPEVAEGEFSVRVTSSVDVVAGVSRFEAITIDDALQNTSSLAVGVAGGGRIHGVLPGVRKSAAGDAVLAAYNNGGVAAVITFTFVLSDGGTVLQPLVVSPSRRGELNLNAIGTLPDDELFTVTYRSTGSPVAVHYEVTNARDHASTLVVTRATRTAYLAGVSVVPGDTSVRQTVSIFNPNAVNSDNTVRLVFSFVDGEEITTDTLALADLARIDLTLGVDTDTTLVGLTALNDKIASAEQFRTFGVEIIGGLHIVAQLETLDTTTGRADTSAATMNGLYATITELFEGGIGE